MAVNRPDFSSRSSLVTNSVSIFAPYLQAWSRSFRFAVFEPQLKGARILLEGGSSAVNAPGQMRSNDDTVTAEPNGRLNNVSKGHRAESIKRELDSGQGAGNAGGEPTVIVFAANHLAFVIEWKHAWCSCGWRGAVEINGNDLFAAGSADGHVAPVAADPTLGRAGDTRDERCCSHRIYGISALLEDAAASGGARGLVFDSAKATRKHGVFLVEFRDGIGDGGERERLSGALQHLATGIKFAHARNVLAFKWLPRQGLPTGKLCARGGNGLVSGAIEVGQGSACSFPARNCLEIYGRNGNDRAEA